MRAGTLREPAGGPAELARPGPAGPTWTPARPGAILAIAMLIVPAATAHLLADRMRGMILWALLHACSSSLLGMYAAVWFDVSAAGAIVLVEGALYLVAVLARNFDRFTCLEGAS